MSVSYLDGVPKGDGGKTHRTNHSINPPSISKGHHNRTHLGREPVEGENGEEVLELPVQVAHQREAVPLRDADLLQGQLRCEDLAGVRQQLQGVLGVCCASMCVSC